PLGSFGVVLSCGVRARKALFYKDFAGSYFLSGSVKNRLFLRKWCSKWCSKMVVGDMMRDGKKEWQKEREFDKIDIDRFFLLEEDLTSVNLLLVL
uniref:hypothetical protein n=1 Tax=Thomasclavelia spiroformis TaxID=29348 RepID=UPI0032089DC6